MSIIVPTTEYRVVSGTTNPIYFIDNTNGTRKIHIEKLIVSVVTGGITPLPGILMRDMTIGTLSDHEALTAQAEKTGGSVPNTYGAAFYGATNSASNAISGLSGGTIIGLPNPGAMSGAPIVILEDYTIEIGDNLALVLPAVGTVSAGVTTSDRDWETL